MATKETIATRIMGFARSFVGLTADWVSRRAPRGVILWGELTAFADDVVFGGAHGLEFLQQRVSTSVPGGFQMCQGGSTIG